MSAAGRQNNSVDASDVLDISSDDTAELLGADDIESVEWAQEKVKVPTQKRSFTLSNTKNRSTKHPNLLLDLPLEIFRMIEECPVLDNVDKRSLQVTSKALQGVGIKVVNPDVAEFCRFNKRFEASIPRPSTNPLAQVLLCQVCKKFDDKSGFPDAHAKAACRARPRSCLDCCIKRGDFKKRCFLLGKEKQFICTACEEIKPVKSEMASLEEDVEYVFSQRFPDFKELEVKVDVRGRRWCKGCIKAIDGFWAYMGTHGRLKQSYSALEFE